MGKNMKKIKESKKSEFYENDDYLVQIKEGGYVTKKNEMFKPWYNPELEEGEYYNAYMEIMCVKNKKTRPHWGQVHEKICEKFIKVC